MLSRSRPNRITRSLVGGAAAALDRAVTLAAGARATRRRGRAEQHSHDERMRVLAAITAAYAQAGDDYFPEPGPIVPSLREVRALPRGGRVRDATWPSRFAPWLPELGPRFARYPDNAVAGARLYLHPQPAPVAVLVHGYLGGRYAFEERVWPINGLYRSGLDVVLFTLPFHGVRARPDRRGTPPFPGADPRMSNEGFRQAITDLRDLLGWLRAAGHERAGVMGMSLGGYTTSLLATIEESLAFAVPIIPLASLADFARDQRRLGNAPEEETAQHRALGAVHRVVDPLVRVPRIAPERVRVVGARADRITPIAHARKLAGHFGTPLETWDGGHLLQVGRADEFRRIVAWLRQLGVVEPRPL